MATIFKLGLLGGRNGIKCSQIQRNLDFGISRRHFNSSSSSLSRRGKLLASLGVLGLGGSAALIYALNQPLNAEGLEMHPPKYTWPHSGVFDSFDYASVRRGYQVYKEVCSACHSLRYKYYRQLVGVCFTEDEAKAEAEQIEVWDGPDDNGQMFKRPGKLTDAFPMPYANDEEARAANNGAIPPDLSFICLARHGAEDYVFSILTGYLDAPAGIDVPDGLFYNIYFAGTKIAMKEPLYNGIIEYPDGTPAYKSQLAKDVCTFLRWTGEPELDWRKRSLLKFLLLWTPIFAWALYMKKHSWSLIKTQKFTFKPMSKRSDK